MSDTNGSQAVGKVLGDAQAVGEAAQKVGQQARQAGSDAIGQAKDVAHDAKERASSVAGAIGDKAASMAAEQKSHLADKLEDVAKAVHRSGEQLEGHQDFVAHLVERGAAELSVVASTLRRNDLQGLLSEVGNLARRQPALFIGASMVAGFALTRVGRLAASAPGTTSSPQTASGTVPSSPGSAVSPHGTASEDSHERQ